ncbi:hypothetical protein BDP27DRAFT_1428075 [Rhodocollybia butyracea]|uniref:Uncharacterized protein n=1 Tax=Rhodocollybia butyracea TaxID=206335 RepID=A0A9P5U0X1_9AGAR|nr:hypothetical protein BDP27DRAFT_1428075 [Rhodocollybia butyracea]
MPTKKTITNVVEMREVTLPTTEWLARLRDENWDQSGRLRDLELCQVTMVEHYRQSSGLMPHEFIIARIEVSENKETRCIQLERLPDRWPLKPSENSCARGKEVVSGASVLESSNQTLIAVGAGSGEADRVFIQGPDDFSRARQAKGYKLVQSVALSKATMNVIDCACLAAVITESSRNYSLRSHMCWWWSAIFFRTVVACYNLENEVVKGPLFKLGGRVVIRGTSWSMIGSRGELHIPVDTFSVEEDTEIMREDYERLEAVQEMQPERNHVKGMMERYTNRRIETWEAIWVNVAEAGGEQQILKTRYAELERNFILLQHQLLEARSQSTTIHD